MVNDTCIISNSTNLVNIYAYYYRNVSIAVLFHCQDVGAINMQNVEFVLHNYLSIIMI